MSARRVTARRAGAAVARKTLRQFDREIAAMDKAAKPVQPISEIATNLLIAEKKSLTDTRLMWLSGNLPLSAEQMAEVDARGCAVAAELAKRFAPVVEQVPADLVERPAEIQTVQFEMGGKQYQTRSSWELLD